MKLTRGQTPLLFIALPFFALLFIAMLPACTPLTSRESLPPVSGLELDGMDTSVRPQDDLFRHANGNWLRDTEIPADKASWGTFDTLRETTLQQLRAIVETSLDNPQSHNEKITAYLYSDLLDLNEEGNANLRLLSEELAAIARVKSHDSLPALFSRLARIGVNSPLASGVGQDQGNSSQYAVYLSQAGLGLPDRDNYFDDSEQGKTLLAGYEDYLQQLLLLAYDRDQTERRVAAVIALEKSLAQHHWTRVANRDAEKTYNPTPADQVIGKLAPRWRAFFTDQTINAQPMYIVRQPSYLQELNELLDATDLRVWRDYLKLQLLNAYAPYLGEDFDQAQFELYGKLLRGTTEQEPRWQRALNFMNASVGEVLGQLYVQQHFPPEAKKHMLKLVGNVKDAFHGSISELEWMTPATRVKALEKLAAFNTKIGYPDNWRDFSKLDIRPGDLIGNIKRIRQWEHERDVERLDQPVDRDEWFMPPQTVNAYYSPSMNEIVFPAAILQPPFFNRAADDAVNYGAIGAVIGHEIGHGFDDQGSRYDGQGNLSNWWSDADRRHFEALGKKLVEQYNQYEPLPGEAMNGELTLGENIGDLGGLSMALRAYELSLKGKKPPVIDGYTGYQRVFLGWAQGWRLMRRDELVRQLLKTGPHSQAEFRVNGVVVNIDGFHEAFDTQPGDGLYKPAEERIKIW